jgi:hypothetical protein
MSAATNRERQRLEAYRERLFEQLQRARAEAAQLEAEIRDVDDQARLLDRLLAAEPSSHREETRGGEVLRAAQLRRTAVEILAGRVGSHRAVHYRDWFSWLLESGFVVLGRRPDAAFLTAISRSPVVARAEEPGTYELRPEALDELLREQSELRAELVDVELVLSREPGDATVASAHREVLRRNLRRLDAQIEEARAADEVLRRSPRLRAVKAS